MNILTKADIVAGLKEVGLKPGDKVLVHSSMAALGKVEGGPETVIDALIETVGEKGLVAVPTFACKAPFDRKSSTTALGAVPDLLWRRPNAVRSLHPTHSVAAIGNGAEELIKDHEKAPTAYGEGTPYYKLAKSGGKILLLGVDQDRNTTLHTAEALAGAPYLKEISSTYIDDEGNQVTIPVAAMAGPHRDFIGLDKLFRGAGIMRIGKIGKAVCRLMDTGKMLQTAVDALKADPAAVLCNNPNCADCVMQRGKIKAARLKDESFKLAAEFWNLADEDAGEDTDGVIAALKGEGITSVEMTAKDYRAHGDALVSAGISIVAIQASPDDVDSARLAAELSVPVIVPVITLDHFNEAMRLARDTTAHVLIMNNSAEAGFYEEMYRQFPDAPKLAFNPAKFAAAGEKPFLQVFYRGIIRKQTEHFYIEDGDCNFPGYGNAEVKEIVSMLRCRSYDGVMTLRSPLGGLDNFRRTAKAFWHLLDNM